MKKILTLLIGLLMAFGSYAQIAVTCAEAAAAMPAQSGSETEETYIVTGYITNTNGAISPSRTDASIDQQTFWMDDAKGSKKTLQGYWCNLPGHEALNVGDKITLTGKILNYNNTPEIKNGDVVILERSSAKIDTIEVSVCEALEKGSSLGNGEYTEDVFKVYGRIKGTDAVNNNGQHTFEMACGEQIFKPYNCKGADGLELGKGDSVVVIGKLYNYNGTIEISNGSVELIEKSQTEEVVYEVTVAEAIEVAMALERGGVTENRYAVTGFVESIVTEYSEQYKNITFLMTDDMSQKTAFHAFRVKVTAEEAAEILPGAKVTVTSTLMHYYRAATEDLEEQDFPETKAGGTFELIAPAEKQPSIPQTAPASPELAENGVQALFSNTYKNRTFNFAPTSWGTQWVEHQYDNGERIFFTESMAWDAFTNWDQSAYNLNGFEMFHADIFVTVDSKIKFTFEALGTGDGGSGWKNGAVVELKANQWNQVDIDLLDSPFDTYDFSDLRYLILEGFQLPDGSSAEGTPLAIANAYFWAQVETPPEPIDQGPFAISVNDGSLADWNNLPASYVAQAFCPADVALTGLKSVKVFADQKYINILVEPNMDDLPDLEWVPFHVYFDTDNSNRTGGYGDQFAEATSDILLEGAVFGNGEPYSYNPAAFKWWGEVGGSGWEWVDWSVDHDGSDCWGALICEGEFPGAASQFVDGKIEIQIPYRYIPADWNMNEFGIGFDIDQNWSSVGLLPQVSPTDANPSGHAKLLKVKVHPSNPEETPIVEKEVVIDGIRYIMNHDDHTARVTYKDELYAGNIVMPAQITYNDAAYDVIGIGEYAFANSYDLTAVTIPNSVTVIGDGAFYACTGLSSIAFPGSVQYFGYQVIGECYNLITVYAPAALMNNYNNLERLETLVITGGELYQYALNYLPQSLKSLDLFAVTNTELPSWALNGRYNLQSLVLPQNLERIDYFAFAECIRLEEIVIPAKVTEIDARAFENCRSLRKVSFAGAALKAVGDWAFYNCHELQVIELPEGVESIGKAAFYGCTYMQEAVVPASVKAIGDNAFALCSKMQKMEVRAIEPPMIEAKTFDEVSREMPVYVPEESVGAYKSDPLWSELNIVGSMSGVDNIGVDARYTKQLIDGQLYLISSDGSIYSATGAKVK